jgi:chromosome segregation ATPase
MGIFGLSLTSTLRNTEAERNKYKRLHKDSEDMYNELDRDHTRILSRNTDLATQLQKARDEAAGLNTQVEKQNTLIKDTAKSIDLHNSVLYDTGKAISAVQTAIRAARNAGKVAPNARQELNKKVDNTLAILVETFPKTVAIVSSASAKK